MWDLAVVRVAGAFVQRSLTACMCTYVHACVYVHVCVFYFAVIKYPDKKQLRGERFYFSSYSQVMVCHCREVTGTEP